MKLGFIGCGNMASAIIGGILKNGLVAKEHIVASCRLPESVNRTKESLGIQGTCDNIEVVNQADVLFLSVKPQYYESVITEIRSFVRPEQIIITIAPGKTLDWLKEQFQKEVKIVRTMPNTPALVGEGITGVCTNELVTPEDTELALKLLRSFGAAEVMAEPLLDVVVSVSGSSPAYVFMMIEAMADAAVADGMPRSQAYRFASQAVLGSAKMVLETGKHPGELKDMVCSPGGTTIEAVRVLESKGFRSSIIECMKSCVKKAREL